MDKPKKHRILLAEDNEDDYMLVRDAFQENDISVDISWVKDGEELMEYLYRRGRYEKPIFAPTPGLLLLDLKMPKKGGLEALKEIKTDPILRFIPVVVLSTSSFEGDVRAAYDLGANAYVRKPVGFVLIAEAMQAIYDFWFRCSRRVLEEA